MPPDSSQICSEQGASREAGVGHIVDLRNLEISSIFDKEGVCVRTETIPEFLSEPILLRSEHKASLFVAYLVLSLIYLW